jgi:phosphoribosyl 1,2-cyclic phosphodiesterase
LIEILPLASGSRGNCYHITDGSTPLLLECGISIKQIRRGLGFGLKNVAACLVSHEHQDHAKAVADVLRAGVEVCTSPGTTKALGLEHHRLRPVRAKETFKVGTWTVRAFETQHDAQEPLGFLLHTRASNERLLYATDTYYIRYKFPGLTHIMVECNYAADILEANVKRGSVPEVLKKRLLASHFSLNNVKEFLKANDLSKVQEIWLLHMSDGNSNANRFKREIQELTGKPVYVAAERR